jgi:hypothetical protein
MKSNLLGTMSDRLRRRKPLLEPVNAKIKQSMKRAMKMKRKNVQPWPKPLRDDSGM